jgi:hypothetical protein
MSVFRAAQRERLIGHFSVFTDRLEQIRDSLLLLLESLAYGVFYHSALKIKSLCAVVRAAFVVDHHSKW